MARNKKATAPVIGLDIGSRWIKAVEVRPGRDGAVITGIGYEPTPEGAVVEDAILDAKAIADAIKRLFSNGGISARKVVSAVSGQSSVVVRIIEVPRMTPQELAETMRWEVERYIPFPSNEVVMDFKPLNRPSTPPDAQNMEVLLAVCQENVVRKHMDTLVEAKLVPEAIEVESVALPRALIHANPGVEKLNIVAVVDIGSASTKVCIYEQTILVFPRTVPIAGINLVRAISQATGMEETEAEQALRDQGMVDLDLVTQLTGGPAVPPPDTFMQDAGAFAPGPSEPGVDTSVFGGGETQIGGLGGPFGAAAAPEPPPVPPPAGFDLGDEFLPVSEQEPEAPASPFDLGSAPEPPPPSAGGVFDLGGDEITTSAPRPVFDLDEEMGSPTVPESATPQPAAEAQPGVGKPNAVAQAIAPVLVELAQELGRSVDYYNSRNPSPVEALVLCGGAAKLPGLAGYLENTLGLPVQVGDPLKALPVNAKRYAPEQLSEVAPIFATCVGLALRDYIGSAD